MFFYASSRSTLKLRVPTRQSAHLCYGLVEKKENEKVHNNNIIINLPSHMNLSLAYSFSIIVVHTCSCSWYIILITLIPLKGFLLLLLCCFWRRVYEKEQFILIHHIIRTERLLYLNLE